MTDNIHHVAIYIPITYFIDPIICTREVLYGIFPQLLEYFRRYDSLYNKIEKTDR